MVNNYYMLISWYYPGYMLVCCRECREKSYDHNHGCRAGYISRWLCWLYYDLVFPIDIYNCIVWDTELYSPLDRLNCFLFGYRPEVLTAAVAAVLVVTVAAVVAGIVPLSFHSTHAQAGKRAKTKKPNYEQIIKRQFNCQKVIDSLIVFCYYSIDS